jgi:hypothetical protein
MIFSRIRCQQERFACCFGADLYCQIELIKLRQFIFAYSVNKGLSRVTVSVGWWRLLQSNLVTNLRYFFLIFKGTERCKLYRMVEKSIHSFVIKLLKIRRNLYKTNLQPHRWIVLTASLLDNFCKILEYVL